MHWGRGETEGEVLLEVPAVVGIEIENLHYGDQIPLASLLVSKVSLFIHGRKRK